MSNLTTRVGAVFAGRSLARGAQFAAFLLLARSLSPDNFGWYGLFTTAILLSSQIGSLGLRQAAAYRIGRELSPASSVLVALLKVWPLLFAISGAAVLMLVGLKLPDVATGFIVVIVMLSMAGAMAIMLMQGVLLGLGRTAMFSLSDTTYSLFLLLQILILMAFDKISLSTTLAAVAISYFMSASYSIFVSYRYSFANGRSENESVIPMVSHGLMFSINLFLILLSGRVSIYLIENMLSASDAGQFFAGLRLGDILVEAAMALGLILFSDTVRAKDPSATMKKNARLAAWILWIFTLGACALALGAQYIAPLLFGKAYAAAGEVLAVTAFMIGPAAATKVIYPPLSACGKPIWGSPAILVSIAANVGLTLALVPKWGLEGASWALVISQFALLFGYAHVLKSKFGISYRETLVPKRRREVEGF